MPQQSAANAMGGRQRSKRGRLQKPAASTRISTGFINSLGWTVILLRISTIQLRAPSCHSPIAQGDASASRHSAASGTANLRQLVQPRMNSTPANRANTPAAAKIAWLRGVSSEGQTAESVMIPTEHRNNTRIRIARSTGQIEPIRFATSSVVSGTAISRISGKGLSLSGRSANRPSAST